MQSLLSTYQVAGDAAERGLFVALNTHLGFFTKSAFTKCANKVAIGFNEIIRIHLCVDDAHRMRCRSLAGRECVGQSKMLLADEADPNSRMNSTVQESGDSRRGHVFLAFQESSGQCRHIFTVQLHHLLESGSEIFIVLKSVYFAQTCQTIEA